MCPARSVGSNGEIPAEVSDVNPRAESGFFKSGKSRHVTNAGAVRS